ncbi:hypothetical protein [Frigidibacter sp. ROC022]|uniref:hypothetical protein n=1 Tax=Frigidibacter sp. ROC022 TaxID=2971796 RepID=UPI00215A74D0|nr:hypothetical protein [Frigidibacter sp. ROC022]MCR8723413.1 hypothetical protein [Frigidibacter sp. ROC022]
MILESAPARRATSGLATLLPAYFGMVMATGIVSPAAWALAFEALSATLLRRLRRG